MMQVWRCPTTYISKRLHPRPVWRVSHGVWTSQRLANQHGPHSNNIYMMKPVKWQFVFYIHIYIYYIHMLFLIILIVYCTSDIVYWKILCLGGLKRLNNIYLHLYSNTKQCIYLLVFWIIESIKWSFILLLLLDILCVRDIYSWRYHAWILDLPKCVGVSRSNFHEKINYLVQ